MNQTGLSTIRSGSVLGLQIAAAVMILSAALSAQPATAPPAPADAAFPDLRAVQEIVAKHFAALPNRQPGDMLSRSDVAPLFALLGRNGWTVAEEKEILQDVLADDDSLVRQLRTPAGQKFMRKVGAVPRGFGHLERLYRMPDGQRQVRELIKSPGGEKLIEYLATTSQGANLETMLAKAPRGKPLGSATKRLYTQADLLKRLEQCYHRELAKRPVEKS